MKAGDIQSRLKPSRNIEAEGYTKAMLNILEDFSEEKFRLEDSLRAMLNLLEDFSMERGKTEKINHRLRKAQRQINESLHEKEELLTQIHHANEELEHKVEERTSQLSEINTYLLNEIEERKRVEQRLRSAQKKLRAMASEIVLSDERSRQRFATDLHDTVVQTLGAAKLRSQLIQDKIPKEVMSIYSEMQDFLSQSITQSRSIMAEMSPPVLHELGFAPALEWLTEQIGKQHGILIKFQTKYVAQMVHEIQVMLFQSTRELLMNVVKHASAKAVAVKVSTNGSNLEIEVRDDGKGFKIEQAFRTEIIGGGFGLFSVRERLRHFGGDLHIQSKPGRGTKVIMTVPRD